MSDKDFVVKNGLVVNNFLTVNTTTIYVGNDVSNATVNTTIYTGSSNNTLYVGDTTAANVVSNNQLQSNLANYVTLAGLQSNVAKLHANSALYLAPATDSAGADYLYTNYARYNQPGTFSNTITVVGNTTFQNTVTITGSYLNTSANSVSFGSAFLIASNGNVGIGTVSPATKLTISSSGPNGLELGVDQGNSNASVRMFLTNGTSALSISNDTGSLKFARNATAGSTTGTETMRITASGSVGIGTPLPGDAGGTKNLVVQSDDSTIIKSISTSATTGTARFDYATSTANSYIISALNENSGTPYYQLSSGAAVLTSYTDFTTQVWRNTGGGVEYMRANSSGFFVTGNVAVSDTIKLGATTLNSTNYSATANNTLYVGSTPAADIANTSLLSSYFKKDSPQEVSANATFSANLIVSNTYGLVISNTAYVFAAGSKGTDGQALISTGTGVKWASVNTSVIVAPGEAAGNSFIVYNNNGTLASNAALKFNFSTNTLIIGTSAANVSINATSFSGTASNALNLGGTAAADYAKKDYSIKLGDTDVALNRSAGALTLSNVSVQFASNAGSLGGTAAANYQGTANLSTAVATLTANNTSFVGSVSAANVVSNSQLASNLSNYSTTSVLQSSGGYTYAATRLYNGANPSAAAMVFNWAGQSGQPTWLWGSNDGTNHYVYNPANFNVNNATTATTATSATSATSATTATNVSGGSVSATSGTFSGNVGIGTAVSGTYKLDVSGTTRINNVLVLPATASEAQIQWTLPSSRIVYLFGRPSDSVFGLYDTTLGTSRWYTDTSGNFTATGNITAYSDVNLKTDIETIDNALDKVSNMRGVMYTRKDTGSRGTGVIAQEMQQVLPEVVQEGETLSVAYGNIVGVLIEAIKELKAEIDQLKGK